MNPNTPNEGASWVRQAWTRKVRAMRATSTNPDVSAALESLLAWGRARTQRTRAREGRLGRRVAQRKKV
jgi:hypothetical protein